MNLLAAEELEAAHPDAGVLLIESGGDNLTLTFSPALVDYQLYIIDVAAGDKIPRKRGQGVTSTDLLVINKTDLAPYVNADLSVMRRDAEAVRGGRPFLFTNCRTGEGLDAVLEHLLHAITRHSDSDHPAETPGGAAHDHRDAPALAHS